MSDAALLPWQHSQWQSLMQCKAAARLPHALLCSGPAGLGKQRFASRLLQSLLCQNLSHSSAADGSPCHTCRGCTLFIAGSHPDYLCIQAEENAPIKVDQIRRLSTFLSYTSRFGGYKAVLLPAAERMNKHAANSLLKTLEEPPPDSLLLLLSARPSGLPATVRSRCRKVIFQRPTEDQALTWLSAQVQNGVDAALVLSLVGGAPLAALACADGETLKRRRALFKGYGQVLTGQADPVRVAQSWIEGDVAENLRWLIGWHVDMIRLKMTAAPPRLCNTDLQAALGRLAAGLSPQILFHRLDEAVRLLQLCETQVNRQLMIEAFLGNAVGE